MTRAYKNIDDLKRKLREIKKFELKIRSEIPGAYYSDSQDYTCRPYSSDNDVSDADLVWGKFFDLKNSSNKNVKYTLNKLLLMTKEEFSEVIEEYFYHVFYRYYKEKGLADSSFIDIDILTELGLPMNAGYDDVIRSFRVRVKAYHPDNGGDSAKFIELMERYNRFRAGIQ